MRAWIATVCFVLATIVLSLLSVIAALIDRSGRSYLYLARLWSKTFLWLYGIKIQVSGLAKLRESEHYVFVANHSSYTDIPVVLAGIPFDIRLILRHELTRVPIWGWALLVSPFLIIDRSNATKAKHTLDKAIDTIARGASVLLFPEGTRTSDGEPQTFKRGAFKMALDSGAAIAPVAIKGTFEILPRTRSLPRTGCSVAVKIGSPITALQDAGMQSRMKELDLMQRTEAAIRTMLQDPETDNLA